MKLSIFFLTFLLTLVAGCAPHPAEGSFKVPPRELRSDTTPRSTKVAVVHFSPKFADKTYNISKIIELTEGAARAGAKIIVHTEMATTGYSFNSRDEVRKVAEPIPGDTTRTIGTVARSHGVYVVVGMPEHDPLSNRFYNSAVLIGPNGDVVGGYRKRSHLIESAWASIGEGPVPVLETEYGRVSMVICADLFYSEFPRMAAVSGADIVLVPANVGLDSQFTRLRAFENGIPLAIANRSGEERPGTKQAAFTQDTFTILTPFPSWSFNGSKSIIVSAEGKIVSQVDGPKDGVGIGEVLMRRRGFPVGRRPDLYAILGQDTLEPYTFRQFSLPAPREVQVAASDIAASSGNDTPIERIRAAADRARATIGPALRILVFPADVMEVSRGALLESAALTDLAKRLNLDLVVGIVEIDGKHRSHMSALVGSDGQVITYHRVHGQPGDGANLGDDFKVIDREYARLALLQGDDLLAPETSRVMAKMGVDIVAVSASLDMDLVSTLWNTRSKDGVHLIVANRVGPEGVYRGSYAVMPDRVESEGFASLTLSMADVRSKKEPRRIDGIDVLLRVKF